MHADIDHHRSFQKWGTEALPTSMKSLRAESGRTDTIAVNCDSVRLSIHVRGAHW